MNKIYEKKFCSHCRIEIPKKLETNYCDICIKLKHCKGCSILLREKTIVNELIKNRPNYKYKPNISPVDDKFCIDCYSEYHMKQYIKEFCSCGAQVTETTDKLDYFIKNGNYCKHCLDKIRQLLGV